MNRPPYSLWQSGGACPDIMISKKRDINIQSIWMLLCYDNHCIVDGITGVYLNLQYRTAHDVIKKGAYSWINHRQESLWWQEMEDTLLTGEDPHICPHVTWFVKK